MQCIGGVDKFIQRFIDQFLRSVAGQLLNTVDREYEEEISENGKWIRPELVTMQKIRICSNRWQAAKMRDAKRNKVGKYGSRANGNEKKFERKKIIHIVCVVLEFDRAQAT